MTTSRIIGGTAIGFLRRFNVVLLAALALGAVILPAQQPSLVGQWRSVDRGATLTLDLHSNGQYIQHTHSGMHVTRQSGQFRLRGSSKIAFSVDNSPARTPQINHATPATPGYSANQQTEMHLGGTNKIVFTGPDRIVLTDESTRRTITMTRVP